MEQYNVTLQNYDNRINNNIYGRNVPSNYVNNNFGFRPTSTKYSKMHILDDFQEPKTSIKMHDTFDINNTFFPATSKPHFDGFATNVDNESKLRNQFFALQKGDAHQFIPSSTSDMYVNNIDFKTFNIDINSSLLFRSENYDNFNPNISNNIGNEIFNNSTRVQLKNI